MLQTCIIKFSCSFAVIPQQQEEKKQTNPAAQVVQGSKLNGSGAPGDESTNMMALAVDDVAPAPVALPIPVATPKAELRQTHTCPEVVLAKICCLLFAMRIV